MSDIYFIESGDPYIRRRTEKGWTLDFVFNKDGYDWIDGSTFYYWGISGETEQAYYADNNLSFSFTEDGKIKWQSIHYKKLSCNSESLYHTLSGETSTMCTGGTSNDFNITITYERNTNLEDCDLCNFGGVNDLITNKMLIVDQLDWLTGATETYTITELLNENWYQSRKYRLGVLKIYLNGQKLYTYKDWEEIIPTQRESENSLIQVFGGGTNESGGIHEGETQFDLKEFNYYEYPFSHLQIKDNYNNLKSSYIIVECNSCDDSPYNFENPPTPMPTATPTPTSTIEPTNTPTFFPTAVPTATPTFFPTLEPTVTPSPTPTFFPTLEPTPTPSST